MLIISHRGNVLGPDTERENNPKYILELVDDSQYVEVDIRRIGGEWFLGHDEPQYKVAQDFLQECGSYLFLHCKNFEALVACNRDFFYRGNVYFWHQNDDFTLTSNGRIWTYPGKPVCKNSIIVADTIPIEPCYGICTDYLYKFTKK